MPTSTRRVFRHGPINWVDTLHRVPGKWKERSLTETEETKRCSWCDELKILELFNKAPRGRKGRAAQCKDCWRGYSKEFNARDDQREKRQKYKDVHREDAESKLKARLYDVERRYGKDALALEVRRTAPDAVCEVCNGRGLKLHIDHCHATGKVRGVLCHKCNLVLGLVNDDPKRLLALVEYVSWSEHL